MSQQCLAIPAGIEPATLRVEIFGTPSEDMFSFKNI
jgi:hypothetical protein